MTTVIVGMAAATLLLTACSADQEASEKTDLGTVSESVPEPSQGTESQSPAASATGVDASIQEANDLISALEAPVSTWPSPATLSRPVDVTGKTVLIVTMSEALPELQAIGIGMQQSLTRAGANVELCDGELKPFVTANCLIQAIDTRADAVMTLNVEYYLFPREFATLSEAGIPVLVAETIPIGDPPVDAPMAFLNGAEQNRQLVELLAKAAVVKEGEDLKALILNPVGITAATTSPPPGSSDAVLAINQIKELCSSCVVEALDLNVYGSPDEVAATVESALAENPRINAIITTDFMEPAITAISNAGLSGQVNLYAIGGRASDLQRVKDGTQSIAIAISPILTGWQFTNGLMQVLAGDEVDQIDDIAGARVFTQANVADLDLEPEAYATTQWFGGDDTDFGQTFLDAWAGK